MYRVRKNLWSIHGHSCERKTYNSHVMGHECIRAPLLKTQRHQWAEPIGAVVVCAPSGRDAMSSRPPPSVCYCLLVEERIVLVVNALLFEEMVVGISVIIGIAVLSFLFFQHYLRVERDKFCQRLDIYSFHILYLFNDDFDIIHYVYACRQVDAPAVTGMHVQLTYCHAVQ